MERNRRSSPFEDLFQIASSLPYWVSLIIAALSYFLFHYFATADAEAAIKPGTALPQNMTAMIFKSISGFLQYIVPLAFVLGASVSAFKAFRGRKLAEQYVSNPVSEFALREPRSSTKPTDDMNWQQFELLVGQAFRQAGYSVVDGGDVGADGGVDVHLRKDGKRFLVQCKHWRSRKVGVQVVRELYGVIAGVGVDGGYVVTSGGFTEEARAFADGKRIELIDGVQLDQMLRKVLEGTESAALKPPPSESAAITCPRCSSVMVKRKARQGRYEGQEFWGCSRFPKCREIRKIESIS